MTSDDLAGLAPSVRRTSTADVAAGEYGYDLGYFQPDGARGVDCLQVDVTRCGGYTEWLRIAAVAAAHGWRCPAHCAPYLHAPAPPRPPSLRHLEWFHDHVRIVRQVVDGSSPLLTACSRPSATADGLRLRHDAYPRP